MPPRKLRVITRVGGGIEPKTTYQTRSTLQPYWGKERGVPEEDCQLRELITPIIERHRVLAAGFSECVGTNGILTEDYYVPRKD
ncbi:MAG: hypothetical protein WC796_04355 [Candidatus Pacearchaeota archaeon]|jgi:hypothetical protein